MMAAAASPAAAVVDGADKHESLRGYQQWLVDKALKDDGNVVGVLPTGTGKTLVAFTVMARALKRHPGRAVVFITPTVVLADQQSAYFQKFCHQHGLEVSVSILAGKKQADIQLGRCALFATPAKFNQLLSSITPGSQREKFRRISLIVFDECHHAVRSQFSNAKGDSDHPYATILQRYKVAAAHARPKLLGLTASPGASQHDVAKLLLAMEATCAFPVGENRDAVKAVANAPETSSPLMEDGPSCQAVIFTIAVKDEEYCKLIQDPKADKDLAIEKHQACVHLMALARCFGLGPKLLEVAKQADVPECESDFFEALNGRYTVPCPSPIHTGILMQLRSLADTPDFRAIIFVPTVSVAKVIVQTLGVLSREKMEYVRAAVLVGQSAQTRADQSNVVDKFQRGEYNVLVATTVAEEGLDIQRCNLVIRTEPPSTVIQNIQSRGRARFPEAKYVVLCLDPAEVETVEKADRKEKQLNVLLEKAQEELADEPPTSTSWSRFDSPADISAAESGGAARPSSLSQDYCSQLNLKIQGIKRPASGEKMWEREVYARVGQDHEPLFTCTIILNEQGYEGQPCPNKKQAKQSAAEAALRSLNIDSSPLEYDGRKKKGWDSTAEFIAACDPGSIDLGDDES